MRALSLLSTHGESTTNVSTGLDADRECRHGSAVGNWHSMYDPSPSSSSTTLTRSSQSPARTTLRQDDERTSVRTYLSSR